MSYTTNTENSSNQNPDLDTRKVKGSRTNKELLSWINNNYKRASENRYAVERQWYLNLAFFFGRHWVEWSSVKAGPISRLIEPPRPPWRVRLTSNQIRRYTRKEYAKITQETPTGYVLPASTDDMDVLAAKAGEKINEHLWRELNVKKQLNNAALWAVLLGNGFIKDGYEFGPEPTDPMAKIMAEIGVADAGDATVTSVNPWHLFVLDLLEPEIENQPIVWHCMGKSPFWVHQKFKVDLSGMTGSAQYNIGTVEERLQSAMGVTASKSYLDQLYIKEAWIKPGYYSMFPDGGVVTTAEETEILDIIDGWPYPFTKKDYPISKIDHVPSGKFYSTSIIEDLIPLQKDYNKSRSQLIEARNRTSKPSLFAYKGAIDPRKYTSEPGLVVQVTPGFEMPVVPRASDIPNYVIEEMERTVREMDDIASQHEISRGSTPPEVTAATAISFLQEQDDSVFHSTVSSIEDAAQKISRHLLTYAGTFWESERQIRVVGDDNEFESYMFSASNLRGNTDYIVQEGSAQPRSMAAKQALIMELFKMGAITSDKMLRHLAMAETGHLYEELQLDTRQAQRENIKLFSSDEEILVHSYDNDISHIIDHDNFCKRQQYENAEDQQKFRFEEHVMQHKMKLCMLLGLPVDIMEPEQIDSVVYRLIGGMPMMDTQGEGGGESGGEEQGTPQPSEELP